MSRFRFAFPLLFSLLFLTFARAQNFGLGNRRDAGNVSGTVRGANGAPLSGVSVELRQMSSGLTAFSTTTSSSGFFALYNIPAGQYEVIAHGRESDVSDAVTVGWFDASVDLRFSEPAVASVGSETSVSVAQMQVPNQARSAYRKAAEAFAQSKFDQAQTQVQKALAVYPHFPEALTLQGLLFMHSNDLLQSQKQFESAIQYDPNYGMAYLALGIIDNNLGQYDDAARTLERCVSIAPNAWQGYFEMAKSYLGKGMYAHAFQLAKKAESLGPSNFAPIHLLKAYALVPQRLYRDAEQELQAFLARDPKGAGADAAHDLLAQVQAAEQSAEHSGQ